MAEKPIKTPLPADLPENWDAGQIVAPDGTAVGLTEQYGYNYLMAAVNRAQRGVNEVNEAFETVSGKRTCRFVVGTSTAGWTEADCDYLCDGTDDQVEIQEAINALPESGGEIVLLDGSYQLSEAVSISASLRRVALTGNPGSTVMSGGGVKFYSYGSSFDWFVEGISFENDGLESINNSLVVKNCIFINTGIHFHQTQSEFFCSFLCCENRFLQSEPLNEQNGVIEVLQFGDGAIGSTPESCVIANNIIEMTAESTTKNKICSFLSSGRHEGMYTFIGNTILCKARCSVYANEAGTITGNAFCNCDIEAYGGGEVAANRLYGCGILVSAVTTYTTFIRCISVSGNSIMNGEISAAGNVEIVGNIVKANEDNDGFAIRLYKTASNDMEEQMPAVVSNYVIGGSYGILLDEPGSSMGNKNCFYAMVNSNRIYGSQTPIKIGKYWSGCMVTDNLFTTGAIEDNGTDNIVRFNSDDTSGGGSTPATVQQATPSITVNGDGTVTARATQAAGYVAAGTRSATHKLSSADDTDLTPENIKNGVSIFGVQGTLDAGGGTAGVSSFNGRSGVVVPGENDYTAKMVGAVAASAVKDILAVTQTEYDSLSAKDPDTLYLIKE